MENKSNFFAEIVQSSLTYINAQCWDYSCVPAHGALIVAECGDMRVYGLVCQCTTGNDDPVYAVDAYGKTQDELKREHPEIFMLLRTRIQAVVIGHGSENCMICSLSSIPAQLHAFVRYATVDEYKFFARQTSYMSLLFAQAQHLAVDELLIAFVARCKKHEIFDQTQLSFLLHSYMQLSGNDYQRTRLLSQRLEAIV